MKYEYHILWNICDRPIVSLFGHASKNGLRRNEAMCHIVYDKANIFALLHLEVLMCGIILDISRLVFIYSLVLS